VAADFGVAWIAAMTPSPPQSRAKYALAIGPWCPKVLILMHFKVDKNYLKAAKCSNPKLQ